MIKVKYQNVELPVLDTYEVEKSSQEVVYSDLKCDFTGKTATQLPEKYQEVQIVDSNNNNKLLFMGYVSSYSFEEMREVDEDMFINLVLFSPMKMATLRTVIANGTYQLDSLLDIILSPLIEDGFVLLSKEVTDRQVTVNYLSETVEYCMNDLSNKFNFWWFIDENKNINIKDISQMLKDEPDYTYDSTNKIGGIECITPTVESEDYANVINFKNVRLYERSLVEYSGSTATTSINPIVSQISDAIEDGEQIDFTYPIDINRYNIYKSSNSNGMIERQKSIDGTVYNDVGTGMLLTGKYNDNTTFTAYIYATEEGQYIQSSNIGINGVDDDKEFQLIKDSFFDNLITGIKFKNDSKTITSITKLESHSILMYVHNKMYNDNGIQSKKGKISDTGIVELTIDMNETWKTIQELTEIATSYMNKNSLKLDGEILIQMDANVFNVGNTLLLNRLLFNGTYIVTNIKTVCENNDFEYYVTCKNANMLSNYIDVFRAESEQTSEQQEAKMYITHYEQETIEQKFEVV